jgi:predicted nucleic acid-binding protein
VTRRAVEAIPGLLAESVPLAALAPRAADLAAEHRISAYDACYLALADARSSHVVTLDERLVRRAREVGLERLVALLPV